MLGKPKIIFFGTPKFAAGILQLLLENKYAVAAVFTQPDKKIGRRQELAYPPVKSLALKNNIKIFQPESLRDQSVIEKIKSIQPDLFVVAAYGKILPKELLEIPILGAVNVHASLLPKLRGASPVQCAILAGEKETGITLMKMNEKMDEGDILAQEKVKIPENETADVLLEKLSQLGSRMIVEFLPDFASGKIRPTAQNHEKATYCKPVRREDGKVDWNAPAEKIYRQWRAYHPWPGIFSFLGIKGQLKRLKLVEISLIAKKETGEKNGKIIKYNQEIAVETKGGLIVLKKIQLEGKKEMAIEEFVKGYPQFVGSILE